MAYACSVGQVYVTNNGDGTLSEILPARPTPSSHTMNIGSFPAGIAFDPGNGYLYVAQEGANNVTVVNPATNTVIASIRVGSFPTAVAYDPWNGNVYVTNYVDGTVSVVNNANQVIATIPVGNLPAR